MFQTEFDSLMRYNKREQRKGIEFHEHILQPKHIRYNIENTDVNENYDVSSFVESEDALHSNSFKIALVIIAVLSGVQNGIMPSLSSYYLLSYSNHVYVYATTIAYAVTPFIALLPAQYPHYFVNQMFIALSVVGWLICAMYLLVIALLSPHPIGKNTDSQLFWEIIVISVTVACSCFITVCKTCIILLVKVVFTHNSIHKQKNSNQLLSKAMEEIGIGIQIGSFFCALLIFILVNFTSIFKD